MWPLCLLRSHLDILLGSWKKDLSLPASTESRMSAHSVTLSAKFWAGRARDGLGGTDIQAHAPLERTLLHGQSMRASSDPLVAFQASTSFFSQS